MPRTLSDKHRSRESPHHSGLRRMWCMLSRGHNAKVTLHITCMSCSPRLILLRSISSGGKNLTFWMVRRGTASSNLLGFLIRFSSLHRRATPFHGLATGNRGRLRYAANFTFGVFRGGFQLLDRSVPARGCYGRNSGKSVSLGTPRRSGAVLPASIWTWPELLDLLVARSPQPTHSKLVK